MSIPCAHFFAADGVVRCDAGRDAEHSTGLKAPDDCGGSCSRYTPCYDNWPDTQDGLDEEWFASWSNAERHVP